MHRNYKTLINFSLIILTKKDKFCLYRIVKVFVGYGLKVTKYKDVIRLEQGRWMKKLVVGKLNQERRQPRNLVKFQ